MTDERKQGLARVLDAAADQYRAGPAGTTAIPAAEAVGPDGTVTAVDLSAQLLLVREKAAAEVGLINLQTHVGDFEATGYADRRTVSTWAGHAALRDRLSQCGSTTFDYELLFAVATREGVSD